MLAPVLSKRAQAFGGTSAAWMSVMFSPLSSSRPAQTGAGQLPGGPVVSPPSSRLTERIPCPGLLRLRVLDPHLLRVVHDDVHELVEALQSARTRVSLPRLRFAVPAPVRRSSSDENAAVR